MTRQSFTRWTCNSCGVHEEMPGADQPKKWVGYGFTGPDIPAGEQTTLGHLCAECAGRVFRALEAEEATR